MAATTYTIMLEQGIPYTQDFIVKNPDNSNKNLTGYTARMHFRTYYSSTDIVLSATTENGKLVITPVSSTCTISLTEADTTALTLAQYVYDLEIVDSLGVPIRLIQGNVKVNPEVTR